MSMRTAIVVGLAAVVVSLAIGVLNAAGASVIHVPGDQPTIQAGIGVANPADVVLVAPGTYKESIDFLGKAITVQSSGGPGVTTITAAGLDTSTVKFVSGETPDATLDGFTVTGGAGTLSGNDRLGGGVYALNSDPTLRNCHINNN